jgi:ankyrin repeat protein
MLHSAEGFSMRPGVRKRIIFYGCFLLLLAVGWYGFMEFYKPAFKNLAPIIEAAKDGDLERLEILLKQGTPIETRGKFFATALVWAAFYGETEAVRFLLDRGADIDSSDMNQTTALTWAVENEHEDTAILLIERGASFHIVDQYKGNTMHRASLRSPRIWEALLKAGVDLEEKDAHQGRTPLHVAAAFEDEDMIEWLLIKGVNINSLNKRQQTPLVDATALGKIDSMEILLKRGANLENVDQEGANALHMAINKRNEKAVRLLVEHGANLQSLW